MNYSIEYGAEMIRAMQKMMEQPKKIEDMIKTMEGKSIEWVVCDKSGIFSYMEMPGYVPVNEIREEMCRIMKDPKPEEDLDPFSVDPFTVRRLVKYPSSCFIGTFIQHFYVFSMNLYWKGQICSVCLLRDHFARSKPCQV